MSDEIHDHSRVDAFMGARRRAMVLHAIWKPMLAGAAGAALVIAAVWVTLPKISYREIEVPKVAMRDVEVPKVTMRDVTVPNIVIKDVTVDHVIPLSPLAHTPEERSFTSTDDWRAADVRGRIVREIGNGFVLATEDHGEQEFDPAKIGSDGKAEPNLAVKDVVTGLIGDLAYCRPRPAGVFNCVALHDGREVAIAQAPVGRPL
jgi:hypothetical protein